jgi:hypothetical protein
LHGVNNTNAGARRSGQEQDRTGKNQKSAGQAGQDRIEQGKAGENKARHGRAR